MMNIGMVLFDLGFWEVVCELMCCIGMLLVIDEMYMISSGFGGYVVVYGFELDMLVVGKLIVGGVLCVVYGFSVEFVVCVK